VIPPNRLGIGSEKLAAAADVPESSWLALAAFAPRGTELVRINVSLPIYLYRADQSFDKHLQELVN
jgi:hypothetical protein